MTQYRTVIDDTRIEPGDTGKIVLSYQELNAIISAVPASRRHTLELVITSEGTQLAVDAYFDTPDHGPASFQADGMTWPFERVDD